MQYFSEPIQYLRTKSDIRAKIMAIDAIIIAMQEAMLEAGKGSNITQYSLNDGQTVISATNRSVKDIVDAITGLEALRAMYVKQIKGGITRLVDGKNFTGRNDC
jgi:hypothetical protein